MAFTGFSPDERAWLASQRLGRLATVSPDGVVGNAPVTYFVRADDTIDIGGMHMGDTSKFRNVVAGSRVAFVVDIVDTSAGWIRTTSRSAARPRRSPMSSRRATGSRTRSSRSTPTGSSRSTSHRPRPDQPGQASTSRLDTITRGCDIEAATSNHSISSERSIRRWRASHGAVLAAN